MSQNPSSKNTYFCYVALKNLVHVFTNGLPATQRHSKGGTKVARRVFHDREDSLREALQSQLPEQRWEGQAVALLRFSLPVGVAVGEGWTALEERLQGGVPANKVAALMGGSSPRVRAINDALFLAGEVAVHELDPSVTILVPEGVVTYD